jgi:hypothetical protein
MEIALLLHGLTRKSIFKRGIPLTVVIVILVGAGFLGYAFGTAFSIGSFSSTYNQSQASLSPSGPTGVTFTSANAQLASLTSPAATGQCTATDSSTSSSPDALTAGSTTFVCLNHIAATGYAGTDTIEQATITWGTTASVSSTYELSIYIGGATSNPVRAYVGTPSSLLSSASAMITFDLTSGAITSVTSLTVIVSQCSGSTCP